MKTNIIILSLLLAACAKDHNEAPVTCEIVEFTAQVTHPDNVDRKSEVLYCTDRRYVINSLTGDGATFTAEKSPVM